MRRHTDWLDMTITNHIFKSNKQVVFNCFQQLNVSALRILESYVQPDLFYSEETVRQRREKAGDLDYLEKQLLQLTSDIKDQIRSMTEDVERKV